MQGHKHTVEADLDGTVSMASRKGSLAEKGAGPARHRQRRTHPTPREGAALENILEIIATLKKAAARSHPDKPTAPYIDACRALVDAISDYGQRFDAQDIDPVDVAPPTDLPEMVDAATHVPPAQYSSAKHAKGTTDDMRKQNSEENGRFLAGLSDAEIVRARAGDAPHRRARAARRRVLPRLQEVPAADRLGQGQAGARAPRGADRREHPLASPPEPVIRCPTGR